MMLLVGCSDPCPDGTMLRGDACVRCAEMAVFTDADGDGAGVDGSAAEMEVCGPLPGGLSLAGGDCADDDPSRAPARPELCNGVDDDCDAASDEGLPLSSFYDDADRDGVGSAAVVMACSARPGLAAESGDCDDGDAVRAPTLEEVCDGRDNDCDENADESLLAVRSPVEVSAEFTSRLHMDLVPYEDGFIAVHAGRDGAVFMARFDRDGAPLESQPLGLTATALAADVLDDPRGPLLVVYASPTVAVVPIDRPSEAVSAEALVSCGPAAYVRAIGDRVFLLCPRADTGSVGYYLREIDPITARLDGLTSRIDPPQMRTPYETVSRVGGELWIGVTADASSGGAVVGYVVRPDLGLDDRFETIELPTPSDARSVLPLDGPAGLLTSAGLLVWQELELATRTLGAPIEQPVMSGPILGRGGLVRLVGVEQIDPEWNFAALAIRSGAAEGQAVRVDTAALGLPPPFSAVEAGVRFAASAAGRGAFLYGFQSPDGAERIALIPIGCE